MIARVLTALMLTLLAASPLLAQAPATSSAAPQDDAATRYAAAVAAYEADRHEEAHELFHALVADGVVHPAVLLGLGNSAYRLGRPVEATYAYEWARQLDPGADDVEENLRVARSHLVQDVTDEASESAAALRERLVRVRTSWTLAVGCVLWTLGWAVLALRQLGRLAGWTWAGVALLALALPFGAHAAWRIEGARGVEHGILQASEVVVRSGPGDDYAALFTLHAGARVESHELRTGWRLIAMKGGPEGWVPAAHVAVIGDIGTLVRP